MHRFESGRRLVFFGPRCDQPRVYYNRMQSNDTDQSRSFMYRLVHFSVHNAYLVIAATIALTALLVYFASQVKINANVVDLIPKNAKVIQLLEKYSRGETLRDYLVVAIEPTEGELFTIENMQAFYSAIQQIEQLPYVHGSVNPFNLLTFKRLGSRLHVVPMSVDKQAPQNHEELELFLQRLMNDTFAKNLVISHDASSVCAILSIDFMDEYGEMLGAIDDIFRETGAAFDWRVGGGITYSHAARILLMGDTPKFLIIAIVVILVVFFTGFRTRRAILLPLIVVCMGTVWTIGLMSILGFNLTLISMMTPPLVLTLGSSYTMHVLNQYYREARSDSHGRTWIPATVSHINKTIILAALTTVIGFGSLLTATLEQVREFGVATSIGIVCSAILALFFLPAALSLLRNPSGQQRQRVQSGALTRLLGRLAHVDIKYRYVILAFLALVLITFALTVQNIAFETDFTSYFRNPERAVEDGAFFDREYGGFAYIHMTLTAPPEKKGFFNDQAVLTKVFEFEESLSKYPDIVSVTSFVTYLTMVNKIMYGATGIPESRALVNLVSRYLKALASSSDAQNEIAATINKDFTQLTINLRVFNSETRSMILEDRLNKLVSQIEAEAATHLGEEFQPEIWGHGLAALYLSETLARDLLMSVFVSTLLIFIVTSIALRSLLYGLFSLIPMVTGTILNFIFMSLFQIPLDVVTIMFSSVAIGVGVDSSIHLLIQFQKQRAIHAGDLYQAIAGTLQTSGRAIMLTLTSIVAGFVVLTLSSFMPIAYFGILVSLVLLTTSVGALIILPAILSVRMSLGVSGTNERRST